MKILEILGPSTGGIRRHVVSLSSALVRLGNDVTIVAPPGTISDSSLAVTEIPFPSLKPRSVFSYRRKVKAITANSDVVHVHGMKALWLLVLAIPRKKTVVSIHNLVLRESTHWYSWPILMIMQKLVPLLAKTTIVINDQMAKSMRFPGTEIVQLFPQIDIDIPSEKRARSEWGNFDGFKILMLARLHPQKGIATAVDAMRKVTNDRTRLFIAGDGPLRSEVEAIVGSSENIVLLGFASESLELVAQADLLLITSVWEGTPSVCFEALAIGTPIVSTDVGLVSTAVRNGNNGFVVPIGDSDAVARSIDSVAADPAFKKRATEAAKDAREWLDPDKLARQFQDLYERLVAK